MSDWKTEELITKVREFINEHPTAGRTAISEVFGITEYKARELLRGDGLLQDKPPAGPTIAVFDLETTNLKGDVGRLLCGSVLSYPSGSMVTFRIDELNSGSYAKDGPLAVAIRDHIERHHIACGWFSKGFDISFLNTRLAKAGERPMNRMLHIDPIWYYRGFRGLKPRSSKMSVVAEFFDIERKQSVDVDVWIDAAGGDIAALDELCDRCESDVRITAELLKKTFDLGLIKNIQCYP